MNDKFLYTAKIMLILKGVAGKDKINMLEDPGLICFNMVLK